MTVRKGGFLRAILVIVLMSFSPVLLSAGSAAPLLYTGCGGPAPAPINAAFDQELIDLVNAERQKQGLPPLKYSPQLAEAARYHAADMQQDGYFEHETLDRVNNQTVYVCKFSDRLSYYYNWEYAGENIAMGYTSPEAVMKGWMESPGHRANILSDKAREIGVGYWKSGRSAAYWVQDFGRSPGVYPLVINREAASTGSPQVSLYIYGTWDEMRLRNDGGNWTKWQPFQNEVSWTLNQNPGLRTVYVEMRSARQTAAASDSIEMTGSSITSPALGGLPESVRFTYSKATGLLWPPQVTLAPVDAQNGMPLSWTLSASGSWFSVNPAQGASPQTFTITPDDYQSLSPGIHTGSVTVTVTSPADVSGSPWVIQLELLVTEDPLTPTYLPLLVR
ncbi:MAG: hypothetical protein GX495_04210 [Chloroflexi bacterium]|jgi:uncharacterized protein YkwD|nr:hypothetical protein [Chloroflexota bacterium]